MKRPEEEREERREGEGEGGRRGGRRGGEGKKGREERREGREGGGELCLPWGLVWAYLAPQCLPDPACQNCWPPSLSE